MRLILFRPVGLPILVTFLQRAHLRLPTHSDMNIWPQPRHFRIADTNLWDTGLPGWPLGGRIEERVIVHTP